jgi:hypothetical protein
MAASGRPDELLALSELALETRHGPRVALMAAPRVRMRLGRDRLAKLRAGDYESEINRRLLAAVDRAGHAIHVLIFDAGGAEGGSWGFDEGLDTAEIEELGYHLIKSQLRLYLEAAKRGVLTVVGVRFGERELSGYERGTDRLAAELEREIAEGEDSRIGRFNLWLIDHIGLWSSQPLDSFLRERAAETTATAERHRRQILRLLEDLDAP